VYPQDGIPARRWVAIGLVALLSAVTVAVSGRRAPLGVAGVRGDALLIDLQERLQRQANVPALPWGWEADVATQAAGGTSFVGDFLVAHLTNDEKLSLVLVDVSGKGVNAGPRSLMLSGALSGLLGAVPAAEFLPAANDFLLRQSWEDEFATAVHLCVDLRTGAYEVRSAGHPPAIHFIAGSGRWRVCDDADGPVLGVVPRPDFRMTAGQMAGGDLLLLYTDGLVERTRRDIYLGIDRLIGQGERLLRGGLHEAATMLVEKLGSKDDDCALVVLQRR
jgi:serine phosphatase RsbU (regulator of sigma subunit)